jgi:hypothetical protein
MSIETYPTNLGQNVIVTLADGAETQAYWDGVQWWVGVEDDDQDAPIMNDFIIAWRNP